MTKKMSDKKQISIFFSTILQYANLKIGRILRGDHVTLEETFFAMNFEDTSL
jgi:hypothetical protein